MSYDLSQTATGGVGFIESGSAAKGALVMCLAWTVNRAATNTKIVGTLPANARIIGMRIMVSVVSDAQSTATVSVGVSGGSATAFTAAQDVKSAIGNFDQVATSGWTLSAASQDITCTYTETGTASANGRIYCAVQYCVV